MVITWNDEDINLKDIDDQTIAIIGYGIQGRAQALNIKDSNLDIIVGLKEGGTSWDIAVKDKQKVFNVPEAVKAADIIHILTPDMVQEEVYKYDIGQYVLKHDDYRMSRFRYAADTDEYYEQIIQIIQICLLLYR